MNGGGRRLNRRYMDLEEIVKGGGMRRSRRCMDLDVG